MTNSVLWLRFSDESIPIEAISEASLQELETPWREALLQIGFSPSSDERFFSCINKTPYLNLSLLTSVLSDGCMTVAKNGDTGFQIHPAKSWLRSSISLVKTHWKLELLLSATAERIESPKVRSLTFGICQQLLLMRLPRHTPEKLAAWLITPEKAPPSVRRTLRQILDVQKKRNELSGAWQDFFKVTSISEEPTPITAAEFVWSDQATPKLNEQSFLENPIPKVWKGLAVCPGTLEGHFWLAPENLKSDAKTPEDVSILISSRARPHAVELYPRASAVLFIEGGVLSHACCVAREQHIPCITGLGRDFLSAIQTLSNNPIRIEILPNQGTGTVTFL
jgi:phosphohistidine swiveling domain-containing protein